MNITTKNKRREFLKNAGSTAIFASIGSLSFTSCDSTEDTSTPITPPPDDKETGAGFTVDGNIYTIDLTHSSFSGLSSEGGWKRFDQGGMLLVNVGQNIIRAFNSACPHAGCRTSWGYTNNNLRCGCHGALFNNQGTVLSGPGGTGDLNSYTVVLQDDILTVTK